MAEAAVGQNQRTVSCPQDRLQTGESPPTTTTAEDPPTTITTTTAEDPPTTITTTTAEDPPSTITTTYYCRRPAYYYYYPRCRGTLHLQNIKPEKYRFKN